MTLLRKSFTMILRWRVINFIISDTLFHYFLDFLMNISKVEILHKYFQAFHELRLR